MSALFFALALLLSAWGIHVVWWRWRLPRHHTAALLLVFALPLLAATGLWLGGNFHLGLKWADIPGIVLFYGAATACYLITYAGVEETSPSLVIIRTLEKAGNWGCSREELSSCITEERFILPRLVALQRDGLVQASGDGARLTPRGLWFARLATLLGRLFNLPEGV